MGKAITRTFNREKQQIENNLCIIDNSGRDMALAAKEIGDILCAIKAEAPRGTFGDWLEANFSRSPRTAQVYMQFSQQTREIEFVTPKVISAHWKEFAHPARESTRNAQHTAHKDSGPATTCARQKCPHCNGSGYLDTPQDGIIDAEIITRPKAFQHLTAQVVTDYAKSIKFDLDGQAFLDFYDACGWVIGQGSKKMKDWKAAVRNWKRRHNGTAKNTTTGRPQQNGRRFGGTHSAEGIVVGDD